MRPASHATARTTGRAIRAAAGITNTATVAAFFGANWRAAFGTDGKSAADSLATPYRRRYHQRPLGDGAH